MWIDCAQISIAEKAVNAASWAHCDLSVGDFNVMEGHSGGLFAAADIGTDGRQKAVVATKSRRHPVASSFNAEAAKALLSSPLPPELIVDFKGTSPLLRNSTSESNVHEECDSLRSRRTSSALPAACRTLSDGTGKENYARRQLESEDSSYDSDYECLESHPPTALVADEEPSVHRLPDPGLPTGAAASSASLASTSSSSSSQHEDVSRTVSDTLAAEFNEYVCVPNPAFQRLNETPETGSDDSSDSSDESTIPDGLMSDPSYANRVEFALKLGYTELQVRKALGKLGHNPAQNELLAELIRLASLGGCGGSGASVASAPEGETAGPDASVRLHKPLTLSHSDDSAFRHIVIDGSNVAISHGNKETFSCRGIQLCVDWFRARGHRDITVFVPMWRKETSKIDTPITNQEILLELERERMLVFTPSRQVGGRRLVCYDDRYILRLAAETDGIVVSNDNYRDLVAENPEFRRIVEERILMYTFVNDRFMPPEDPFGRNGPKLDQFLRKARSDPSVSPPCPYGKKCTYGNKCKYYHPERGNAPQKTITERLAEQAHKQLQEVKARTSAGGAAAKKTPPLRHELTSKTLSLPLAKDMTSGKVSSPKKTPLSRTKSITPGMSSLLPAELLEERPVKEATNHQPAEEGENKSARSRMLHQGPPPTTGFCMPPPIRIEPPSGWSHQQQVYHMPLTQRLSDPPPPVQERPELEESGANPHRKVHRQLTLNPSYDPRLYTMKNSAHGPLAPPYPPPPLPVHNHLTRNASAPASQICHPPSANRHVQAPHMQRLNSTSDTQLNLYGGLVLPGGGSQSSVGDPFSEEWTKSPPPPLMAPPHSWAVRTSSLPAPHPAAPPPPHPAALAASDLTEARYKLFFHLAAIFPEQQVRQVMAMMPEETNAQKICAAILALYPKDH